MKAQKRSEEEDIPTFFKFLADDSLDYLPICPAFVKKYLEDNYPNNPILIKTESDKSWTVEIGRIGQKHCLLNGWLRFMKDNKLETGDFLVFWLIADSTFHVAMYGPSCCQKISIPCGTGEICKVGGDKKKEKFEHDISGSESTESPPWYSKVIAKSHRYHLPLTRRFATKAGIITKRKMVVRNEKGKKWEVRAAMRNCSYCLTSGWFSFYNANSLETGDTCFFTLPNPPQDHLTPILDVKVLKKSKGKRGENSVW